MEAVSQLITLGKIDEAKPWLLQMRSSPWFITTAVGVAIFTETFLYAVVGPVFPHSLPARLQVPRVQVQQWVDILFSMEAVGLLVSAPFFGYLSDRINNRKLPLLIGMILLLGAHTMMCIGTSLQLLIVGRLLQGASAGAVWCVGLALLADTAKAGDVGKIMGRATCAYSVAGFLAPMLGGIVYQKAGYYAVFGIGFGLIAVDLAFRLLLIEPKNAEKWLADTTFRLDMGPVLTTATEKDILHYISTPEPAATPSQPTDRPGSQASDATTTSTRERQSLSDLSSSTSLLKVTSKVRKRLPPVLVLLKSHRMQATFLANTVNAMVLTGFDVTLALFVEEAFGWDAMGAGLSFLPLLLPSFLQRMFGAVVDKYGSRVPATAGLLLSVAPYACLRFVTHDSTSQKVLFCALLFLIGTGSALALAATMAEFTHIAKEKEARQPGSMGRNGAYAQSYSLFNVSWAIGSIVGAYFAGGICDRSGWGTVGWSYATLCGTVAIPTFLFCGGSLWKARKERLDDNEKGSNASDSSSNEADV